MRKEELKVKREEEKEEEEYLRLSEAKFVGEESYGKEEHMEKKEECKGKRKGNIMKGMKIWRKKRGM